MLRPWLVSDRTGILSVGVRAHKLASTHSGSACSETSAAAMSQSWAPSGRSPSFPGEKSPPHTGSQRPGPTQGCRGAGCALPPSASFTGSSPTAEMVPPAPATPSLARQSWRTEPRSSPGSHPARGTLVGPARAPHVIWRVGSR